MEKEPLSLSVLLGQIKDVMKASFKSSYWVKAEISEISVNYSGHCYLDLIEKNENSDAVTAKVRGTIWASVYRMASVYFESVTGRQLEKGLKILVKVSIEFSELYGLSVNVLDIDPSFTIGEQERLRREIILQLENDGVIDMNAETPLPTVIQRIAVLSSQSAAGYGDFIHQLNRNSFGYSFHYTLFPSVMQGQKTAESLISNLEKIYEQESDFDVVVIIRGGGSKADLAWFDNYELALHIAQFPLPIISGIGHERDKSVVDMVSHTSLKTPTAVAEFIIEHTREFEETIRQLGQQCIDFVQDELDADNTFLKNMIFTIQPIVSQLESKHTSKLSSLVNRLQIHNTRFYEKNTQQLHSLAQQSIYSCNVELAKNNQVVKSALDRNGKAVAHFIKEQELKIQSIGDKSFAYDPARILEQGFSLTYDAQGKLLRTAKQVSENDVITTMFIDGKIRSSVLKK